MLPANMVVLLKVLPYALRGKVHLYDKEWQSAINDFEEIVYNKSNNYGYALDDDYARVF